MFKIFETYNRNERLWIFGTFAYIFLFLLLANFLFPTQSDDFDAHLQALKVWNGGGAFEDFLRRFFSTYLDWDSRIGDVIYTGFLAKFNASVLFDFFLSILGTSFFIAFFVLLFARLPKSFEDVVILFLLLFLVLFFGAFGSDFLWGSGALNNLFGIVLILSSLIPYRLFWQDYYDGKNLEKHFKPSKIKLLGIFALSFFAGWGFELGIIVVIAHIAVLFFAIAKKIKLPAWYYAGVFGFVVGYCVLYFAPGPRKRAKLFEHYLSLGEIWRLSMYEKYLRLKMAFRGFYASVLPASILCVLFYFALLFSKSRPTLVVWMTWIGYVLLSIILFVLLKHLTYFYLLYLIVLLIAIVVFYKKQIPDFKFLCVIGCLYLAWGIGAASLVQILGIPDRTKLFPSLLCFAIIVFSLLKIYQILSLRARMFCVAMVLIASLSESLFVASEYLKFRIKWEALKVSIQAQKTMGNRDIVLDERFFRSRYRNFGDYGNPGTEANRWPNPNYARYFDVDSIRTQIPEKNDFDPNFSD
ncbi:DUF6056 family protein [Helicobacter sp. 11S02596-1]|uniref:DUF6056 family protein n=1 Tax=Helicobacter sp. 11S02596-1 TaxID=1476194 RepID=UPI000BA6C50C|nr:DUF6056 family protein [Helicobacter sp. 11S02596-1]PAF41536.1 hypothetical protein BJI48_08430 [Helicobacter sp. 11S02596-1]